MERQGKGWRGGRRLTLPPLARIPAGAHDRTRDMRHIGLNVDTAAAAAFISVNSI